MPKTLSESVENYLEAILILRNQSGTVRLKDISARLGVSMPSVHSALHVLEDAGLLSHERYGFVELTKKGVTAAQRVYAAHQALVEFLVGVLGVRPEIGEGEACRMEHVLSADTLDRLIAFTGKTKRPLPARSPVRTRHGSR